MEKRRAPYFKTAKYISDEIDKGESKSNIFKVLSEKYNSESFIATLVDQAASKKMKNDSRWINRTLITIFIILLLIHLALFPLSFMQEVKLSKLLLFNTILFTYSTFMIFKLRYFDKNTYISFFIFIFLGIAKNIKVKLEFEGVLDYIHSIQFYAHLAILIFGTFYFISTMVKGGFSYPKKDKDGNYIFKD